MKFLGSVHYMVWLVISAIFFAVVEFFSKKFALSPKFSFIILIVVLDIFCVLTWLPVILQKNSLSIVGVMWSVLSLVATVLMGVLIFGEKISFIGTLGLISSFISIILLSIG
jgi:multidrug transporter EmrE-like cation transporter